jgi:hypothetical protein
MNVHLQKNSRNAPLVRSHVRKLTFILQQAAT